MEAYEIENLPWEMVEEITQYLDAVDINNLCRASVRIAQRMRLAKCRVTKINMDRKTDEKPDVKAIYEIAEYCGKIDTVTIDFKQVRGKVTKLETRQSHSGILRLAKEARIRPTEVQGIWQSMSRNYMNNGQDYYIKALEKCFGEKIRNLTLRNFVYGSKAQNGINRIWKNVTKLDISMDHTTWIDRCRTKHFLAGFWSLKEIKIRNMTDLHGESNILTNISVNTVERITFDARTTPEWSDVLDRQKKLKYLKCTMSKERSRIKPVALEEADITVPRHHNYIGLPGNASDGVTKLFEVDTLKKLTIRADGPDIIKRILRRAKRNSGIKELSIIEEYHGQYIESAIAREAKSMLNEFTNVEIKTYATQRTQ